jgi:DNA-binding NarL/FixJ family response regulator
VADDNLAIHMSRVIGKVDARNRIDAIRVAADTGWT